MKIRNQYLNFAWLVSLVATVGSLFFSEAMKLPPCKLCWLQRIFMYPLVYLLAVAIIRKDLRIKLFTIPLAVLGLLIAVYHNLLYYKIIPESLKPCTEGVSCTSRQIEWLGFITIPFLSLVAFTLVVGFLSFYKEEPVMKGHKL